MQFKNSGILVKSLSEIPQQFIGCQQLYLDVETSSGDPKLMSVNPWHHCTVAGIALTADDCPNAYYIDKRYCENWAAVPQYLQDLLWYTPLWINHNIKYDAHVLTNDLGITLPPWIELLDTLTLAKLVDSDRGGARGGYGLNALSKHWLNADISEFEERLQPYLGRNNKDYGAIPADIIGEYSCQDVFSVRDLYKYLQTRLPDRCKGVAHTEMLLTKELYKVEQTGLRFRPFDIQIAQLKALNRMQNLDDELTKLTGESFRPHVNEDCSQILCGKYGLPIVAYTKDTAGEFTDNASFDKQALALYKAMPYAPQDVIERIIEYRKLSQRNNLFFNPLQEYAPDGLLHCTFNQCVRTGRMSGSEPNPQQFDDDICGLIVPPDGWSIISTDASQIEFRLILHYIQDQKGIAALNENPDTDFHNMVADLCNITRKPAKTINFGTAFGEGMKKLIGQLKANDDIIAAVKAEVAELSLPTESARQRMFDQLAEARGKHVYNTYHATFPTLKSTAKYAESLCKSLERRLGIGLDSAHAYGYITNLYGRDRHLPYLKERRYDYKTKDSYDKAWLAFPTLNQSSAADLMKERCVYLMRKVIQDLPIKLINIVHDELVFMAPNEIANDPRTIRDIIAVLESPNAYLREQNRQEISVPIRWSIGVSEKNWLEASTIVKDGGKSAMLQYNKADAQNLEWLR